VNSPDLNNLTRLEKISTALCEWYLTKTKRQVFNLMKKDSFTPCQSSLKPSVDEMNEIRARNLFTA